MKNKYLISLVGVGVLILSHAISVSAKPVPLIFDTDITGDVDDALALAMLHTLANRGKCEILAITISKNNPLAAPFVDAVNTFYGRPDIPIGVNPNAPDRDSKYLSMVETKDGEKFRYPHDIGVTVEPGNAVDLLRETLEKAEDGSVAVIQVGLAVNIAALLESEGGQDLIARKVNHLSVMAGAFKTIGSNNRYLEANVVNHVPSMQTLALQWPDQVPVIWSGFSIGKAVTYPRESIANDFNYTAHHPIKEAYLLHSGPNHDRPCWDLTSVLYSVFPDRGYFNLSAKGHVRVDDDGFTSFFTGKNKRDRFLTMNGLQAVRVREAFVQLCSEPNITE